MPHTPDYTPAPDRAAPPDRTRRGLLTALGLSLGAGLPLAGCSTVVDAPVPPLPATADFDAWSEAFAAAWVRQSPERATMTQYFSGAEQAALDRLLGPQTPERFAAQQRLARRGLAQLDAFRPERLGPEQRVSAAILRWSLERSVAAEPYQDHNFLFNQLSGPHLRLVGFLTVSHPLRSAADVEAYLERLAQVAPRLDESLARCRAALARGLLPPRFIAERARGQVQAVLAAPAARSEFVTALARRSESITGLSAEGRAQALARATALVGEQVLPAYGRVLALLDEWLPRTTADAGLWRLPDGDKAYAQALAANTTTTMGAQEIHDIGLREVARIEAEMDRLLRSLGRREGSVNQRYAALRDETSPPPEPDPRPALLARYAEAVRDAERRARDLFNLQPRAPVEVRRVPALTERTSSAYYTTPAPDGSLPGIFWMPLPGPSYNVLGMRSLAIHEAVPGHHFQLALQQEQATLPKWRQRRIFGGGSAHSEGWALYAERLAIEHGWYEGDPHGLLGALNSELFRARRLVVDTGLHAKRWTRERSIAYGIGAQEVERYVVNPGQATAYMTGMLRIVALRDEARRALGAAFDIKAFHDAVLTTGSVPLDVLAGVLRDWTEARRRA